MKTATKPTPTKPDTHFRSEADKLKAAGINATRESITRLAPEVLTLIKDKDHPLYDPRVDWAVDPEDPTYKDIAENGVRNPIQVRKNGVDKAGRPILQVIAGRRRVLTVLHLNKVSPPKDGPRTVPVKFVVGDDSQMVLLALEENHHRAEETPLSRAWKINSAKKLGRTDAEIAAACGWVSTQPVKEHLQLLSFVPELQQEFDGKLPASAIKSFTSVPREEQLAALAVVHDGKAQTAREVKAAVKASRTGETYVAPPPAKKMWGRERVEALEAALKKLEWAALGEMDKLLKLRDSLATPLDMPIENEPSARKMPTPEVDAQLHAQHVILAELRPTRAMVSYLLGQEDALGMHPTLQEAVVLAVAKS